MSDMLSTKKALILQAARAIGAQKFTPAEIEQLRRRLIAEHGEDAKTSCVSTNSCANSSPMVSAPPSSAS